jgi:hypothetical protein
MSVTRRQEETKTNAGIVNIRMIKRAKKRGMDGKKEGSSDIT